MRFSIRDLLWLTLVIAMAFGWWIDRQRLLADSQVVIDRANELAMTYNLSVQALEKTLADDGYTVTCDFDSLKVTVLWPKQANGFVRHRTFSINPANAPLVYELIDEN